MTKTQRARLVKTVQFPYTIESRQGDGFWERYQTIQSPTDERMFIEHAARGRDYRIARDLPLAPKSALAI